MYYTDLYNLYSQWTNQMYENTIYTTLLTAEQIWGDGALDVIKEYGRRTGFSDLAILLGGRKGLNTTSDRLVAGYVWSSSATNGGDVRAVCENGDKDWYGPCKRILGARPALPASVTSNIRTDAASAKSVIIKASQSEIDEYNEKHRLPDFPLKAWDGVKHTIEFRQFGEFPQTIVDNNRTDELERAFNANILRTTGKKYTFDGEVYNAYDKPFKPLDCPEYTHNGKRYIRVVGVGQDRNSVLSDGSKLIHNKPYWVEVQPIEWLVDKSGWWVAHKCLFSGVKFADDRCYNGDFSKTNMNQYLVQYFTPQMMQCYAPDMVKDTQTPQTMADDSEILKALEEIRASIKRIEDAMKQRGSR